MLFAPLMACVLATGSGGPGPDLPDPLIAEAYAKAATQNVMAAVNPRVFPGYWSVCADGQGFGYGNTYPSLDGHQMTDALLFLGQVEVVKLNWDYVRGFMRPDGQLPLAIFPAQAAKDSNGGLYQHWVPGDPLRALAGPTFIQNADVIYRATLDRAWLARELPAVNRVAGYLAGLVEPDGRVRGAGYYVERPARIEYDGVAQCHVADAFRRVAALNRAGGDRREAARFAALGARITRRFNATFWQVGQFAEYIHPQRGAVTRHGLTDTDWSAIACGLAAPEHVAALWPRLRAETRLHYGGMPTGIAALPESYEDWEFTVNDRMDLASMGRVWYLECWARARMGDAEGMLATVRRVCEAGRSGGYYWRERYTAKGGHGAEKYCEYPANLIRIIQRFVLGVEHELDGGLTLAPTVPAGWWHAGFGQTLAWRGRRLSYRMGAGGMTGAYSGAEPQRVTVALAGAPVGPVLAVSVDGRALRSGRSRGRLAFVLPAASASRPCRFEVRAAVAGKR